MAQIPPDVPDEKAVYCCDIDVHGIHGSRERRDSIGGTFAAIFALGPVGLMSIAGG